MAKSNKFSKRYKGGGVNLTGYKKGEKTSDNSFNIIPDNNISMDGVDTDLISFIYDADGTLKGMKELNPGKDYSMKGDYVLEVPKYKKGGKNQWISNKISKLVKEGKPQKQAVAIAYSMYENRKQLGGDYSRFRNKEGLMEQSQPEYPYIPQENTFGNSILDNPFGDENEQLLNDEFNAMYSQKGDPTNQYLDELFSQNNNLLRRKNQPDNTVDFQGQTQAAPDLSFLEGIDQGLQEEEAQNNLAFANTLPQDNIEGTVNTQVQNKANQSLNQQPVDSNTGASSLDPNGKFQFFNPYAGVDIPTAASVLGQSIEGGNTLGTVLSSAKLITGLGRNITGGIGQQRRNQFVVDEYNDKQRKGLTQASYQSGGELTDIDVANINEGITDFDFTPDMARTLFEKRPPQQPVSAPYVPKLGKYGDVGYFNIDKVEGDDIILSNTDKNPHNAQTIKQLIPYLREQNPGKNIDIKYNLKSGGKITDEKVLTDEFSGPDDVNAPNAEIEAGEYRKDPDGTTTEVLGETHENGGVEVDLEEGTKILSDHEKIGGDVAKMFRKDFDLKVKAKNTYASVLDKFKAKSGYNKIIEEMESVIEKVGKETEKEDSMTKELNLEFLSKKVKELEDKKKPLEVAKQDLFDKLFDLQEKSKTTKEQKQFFQIGGQFYSTDQIISFGKQHGMEPEETKQFIGKLGGYYQSGGFGTQGTAKGLPAGQSRDEETGLFGGIGLKELSQTMVSNPWYDWSNFDPSNPNDVLSFQQEFNKRSTEGKQIKEDSKFGIQTQSAMLPFSSEGNVMLQQDTPTGALPNQQFAPEVIPGDFTDKERQALNTVLLPPQDPVLPSTLQPVLKNQRRYGRIDPAMIDPTQELSEIDRAERSAQTALESRTDSSRAATLAQLAANSQQAASETVAKANRINAQAQQFADAFNVRQADREEDAAASDALSYEQRMLTGLSKTEQDVRDYFENLQELNLQNYNTINELNYLNALSDNFQFDGNDFIQTGTTDTPEEILQKLKVAMAAKQSAQPKKAKYGGRKKKK